MRKARERCAVRSAQIRSAPQSRRGQSAGRAAFGLGARSPTRSLCRGTWVPGPLPRGLSAPRAGAGPGTAAREGARSEQSRVHGRAAPGPLPAPAGDRRRQTRAAGGRAVRLRPVGGRSSSAEAQRLCPRDAPRGTGESLAAPRLSLPGQPPQLWVFRPRPGREGLRTEVRGGPAQVSARPWAPPAAPAAVAWRRSSGARALRAHRGCPAQLSWAGQWAPASGAQAGPRTPEVIGQSCRGKRPRSTREEARPVPPPAAARLGLSPRGEAPARRETPAPSTGLPARDLENNIGRRSRVLAQR